MAVLALTLQRWWMGSSRGFTCAPSRAFGRNGRIVSTFVVPGQPDSGSRVYVEMVEDGFAERSRADILRTCAELKTTAAVYVGRETKDGCYPVRWYAASGFEYNMCGHGNLALGIFSASGDAHAQTSRAVTVLSARRGTKHRLEVDRGGGGRVGEALVTQHAWRLSDYPSSKVAAEALGDARKLLSKLLGIDARSILNVFEVSNGLDGAIIQVDCEASVRNVQAAKLERLSGEYQGFTQASSSWSVKDGAKISRGFLVFAGRGDFSFRAFYPQLGIPEDMVTGTAQALITGCIHTWLNPASADRVSRQLFPGVDGLIFSKVGDGDDPLIHQWGFAKTDAAPGQPKDQEPQHEPGCLAEDLAGKLPMLRLGSTVAPMVATLLRSFSIPTSLLMGGSPLQLPKGTP